MRIILFSFIFFIPFFLFAQKAKSPSIGKIYGRVLDETTKKPLEFATISVFNLGDSLIGGALVQSNGDFLVDRLPIGPAKVKVYYIGYEAIFKTIKLMPPQAEQDLGNIKLNVNVKNLKEVNIIEETPTVTLGIDKRTYNPDKDLGARGGTAVDAMKSIPGITVNSDGTVVLRNSSPIIFVDGRPTALSLDQILADQIERIEVITNPSAKYVADATGGILNVVMKKNLKPGYNGAFNTGIGSNKRYNLGGNINVREGKWSFNLSYGNNTATNNNEGFTNRNNFTDGIFSSANRLSLNSIATRSGQNGRLQVDYKINNRNTIFATQSISGNTFEVNETQNFRFSDATDATILFGDRLNKQRTTWNMINSQLGFKHSFPKAGKELSTDLNFIHSSNQNNSYFDTKNYSNSGEILPNNPVLQDNRGSRTADFITWQLDFTNPVTDTAKWEMGLRAAYKLSNSDFDVSQFSYQTYDFEFDSTLSNMFRIDDFVGAAYVNYSNMFKKKIAYQAGLRFEQTYFVGTLPDRNESFEYIYPKGLKNLDKALFPSIYFSRKFNPKNEAQLNFSRKIKRPDFMQLIPFIMFADRQSYQIGNPVLAPEFLNMAEVNYSSIFKKGNLLTSLYFKHTTNTITNFFSPSPTDPEVLVGSYINGRSSSNFGWENTLKYSPFSMIDVTFNAHVFYTEISASQNNVLISNGGFSWNTKAMVALRLKNKLSFQVNGNYEAPRIIPQGRLREIYFMDLSVNKEFNKHWSASATLSDVFNSKQFGTFYSSEVFQQDISRRWETRYVRFNLTYKFGEPDFSFFRKRNAQRREPGSGGTDMPEM